MSRVNIEVDPKVWIRVGVAALLKQTTKKAIVDAALKEYCNKVILEK